MVKRSALAVLVWLMAAMPLNAAAVNVGMHALLPDTPGQAISIMVTGGDAVQGLNLNVQIADGGPSAGGTVTGPAITAVDLLTGTIFSGNNTGQVGGVIVPQVASVYTTTASGTVAADGLLATLTISTAGIHAGAFELILSDTLNGPTDFAGTPIDITDGMIQIVPEPATVLLLAVVPIGAMIRRRGSRICLH